MNTCIIHHLKKIVSIHKYHLKKKMCPSKKQRFGSRRFVWVRNLHGKFPKPSLFICGMNIIKIHTLWRTATKPPWGKIGAVVLIEKKNWFDSGKLADCFFQAGELHQVSHLMCWRWTSVAKNNHWSILPVPWVFVGHFWNPFGGCPLTSSQPQILKGQWFDSRQILKGSQNFWTNYPFWKKLCDGTSRLHQFFEKDKISFQTTKT